MKMDFQTQQTSVQLSMKYADTHASAASAKLTSTT